MTPEYGKTDEEEEEEEEEEIDDERYDRHDLNFTPDITTILDNMLCIPFQIHLVGRCCSSRLSCIDATRSLHQ